MSQFFGWLLGSIENLPNPVKDTAIDAILWMDHSTYRISNTVKHLTGITGKEQKRVQVIVQEEISFDDLPSDVREAFTQRGKLQIAYEDKKFEAVYDLVQEKYVIGDNNHNNTLTNVQGSNNTVGSNNIQGNNTMTINYNYKIHLTVILKTPDEIASCINEIAQALPKAEIEYKQQ